MASKASSGALYHERLANSFQLSVSILVPVMAIMCGFLAREGIFDPNFYIGDSVFITCSVGYVFASVLYLYLRQRRRLTRIITLCCLVLGNVITLLFTTFVTGFVSVFLIAWIPLMVSTDLYFGRLGFVFSFAALVMSGVLTALLYPHPENPLYLIVLTQEIVCIGAVALVIAAIRRHAEKEGRAFVHMSEQEELQRERLLSLINSMSDAVVATDDQGKITIYNASFLALLDTNADITGQSIDEALHLRDRQHKPVSIMRQARRIRKAFSRTDLTHTFTDGEVVRLYINVSPIRASYRSRTERGFIFVLRDITKEKTLEDQQDEFISVISHELRTPIAIAEGNLSNIQVLRQQGASEKAIDQVINDAHRHIVNLAKTVNDLSTLSRAEQGIGYASERISLKDLMAKLYKKYLPEAQAKGLRLELDLTNRLPAIRTNQAYLEEILENLLSNAIKYTAEGHITLSVHRSEGALTISVKDTGIGISKSDQPHIFEKFYRSEDYRTRESTGTGLGLYISARLAQKLGYSLSFKSRLRHGSTFTLSLKEKER